MVGRGKYGTGLRAGHYMGREVNNCVLSSSSSSPNLDNPGFPSNNLKLLLLNNRSLNNKTYVSEDLILEEQADLPTLHN